MTSLSQIYAENGFQAIEVDGEPSHPFFRRPVAAGDTIRIEWISVGTPRPQGLSLRVRLPGVSGPEGYGGILRVGDVDAPSIALWEATSPHTIDCVCVEAEPDAVLQISNQWRTEENGRVDEWLNNYGMRITVHDDETVTLQCSDGYGSPEYDNLVVRVGFGR